MPGDVKTLRTSGAEARVICVGSGTAEDGHGKCVYIITEGLEICGTGYNFRSIDLRAGLERGLLGVGLDYGWTRVDPCYLRLTRRGSCLR